MKLWMKIPDYDYEVSMNGEVRNKHGKMLKKLKYPNGYEFVALCKNGDKKPMMVHRLVAMVFIPNPENKETVNHKDGVKTNNSMFNLEWATMGENNAHAYRTGLRKHHRCWKGKFGADHNKSKRVYEVVLENGELNVIGDYGSAREPQGKQEFHLQAFSNVVVDSGS